MANLRSELTRLASLIKERNELEQRITAIIGRPASLGHIGEFVASKVFEIELSSAANARSIDGFFTVGPFAGRSVNVKWYGQHEGILDMCVNSPPDFYLVLSGPPKPKDKTERTRPWLIRRVFLFESDALIPRITENRIGTATGVRVAVWDSCEIYPRPNPGLLELTDQQRETLSLFG